MDPLNQLQTEEPLLAINFSEELPAKLNNKISDFLREASRPKYSKPLSYEQTVQLVQEFYKEFKELAEVVVKGSLKYNRVELKEVGVPPSDDEQKVDKYLEIAEYRVTSALYDRLLVKSPETNKVNQYINIKFNVIQKAVALDYAQLIDVHDVDLKLPILQKISNFRDFQTLRTPYQKLASLLRIHSRLNNFLKEHLRSQNISGDYILPMLIHSLLINSNPVDFYQNFVYIKHFRNENNLTGDALYCLTNLEAALTFIQAIDLSSYNDFDPALTKEEEAVKNQIEDSPAAAAGSFFYSTFDSSVKILSKFKPETGSVDVDINPIKNFMGDVMKWTRSSTPLTTSSTITSPQRDIRSRSSSLSSKFLKRHSAIDVIDPPPKIDVDLGKFNGMNFEDLTITQLKELFNNYQILVEQLKH